MQQQHRDRVKTMGTMINNAPPPIFKHLEYKPKKVQLLEERYSEIEKNNKLLMHKMANIIQNKQTF